MMTYKRKTAKKKNVTRKKCVLEKASPKLGQLRCFIKTARLKNNIQEKETKRKEKEPNKRAWLPRANWKRKLGEDDNRFK